MTDEENEVRSEAINEIAQCVYRMMHRFRRMNNETPGTEFLYPLCGGTLYGFPGSSGSYELIFQRRAGSAMLANPIWDTPIHVRRSFLLQISSIMYEFIARAYDRASIDRMPLAADSVEAAVADNSADAIMQSWMESEDA